MNALRDMAVALDYGLALDACGFDADPWQVDFLRSTHPRTILCCGRQVGKSTVVSLLVACNAIYRPRSLALVITPSERTSKEVALKVKDALDRLGNAGELTAKEAALEIVLKNKSRVIALPGNEAAPRGWSPDIVLVDEAARVPRETLTAVRPSLAATGGRLILVSTPGTLHDAYADIWHGDGDWHRVHVRSRDCPRISQEFLREEARTLQAWQYSTEYDAAFARDSEACVFPAHMVEACVTAKVEPLRFGWPRFA